MSTANITIDHPQYPWPLNPVDPAEIPAQEAADEVIKYLKPRANTWGQRLEDLIHNGVRLLSDANAKEAAQSPAQQIAAFELEQLPRLYTDPTFRRQVIQETVDPGVWSDWAKHINLWLIYGDSKDCQNAIEREIGKFSAARQDNAANPAEHPN